MNLFVKNEVPVERFKPQRGFDDPEEQMNRQVESLKAVSSAPEMGPNGPVFRDPFAEENLPPEDPDDWDEDD